MHNYILIIILSFNVTTLSGSQSTYNITYQNQFYHNITAQNFNSGFYLYDYLDSLIVPQFNFSTEKRITKYISPIFRFGKLFLTNYLITDYSLTMNHELGHGYRMIEAGGRIKEIVYNWPPPFSSDFSYITLDRPTNFTKQQELMINLGGSEINLMFSDIMRKNILLDGRFRYNYGLAYLYSSNDMPGYTAFVSSPAGDPARYRKNLNELYAASGKRLTRERIKTYSYLALFTDPMNFYALKSVFYDYVFKGKNGSKVKMINLNSRLKYLPRIRFEYTPFGPELVYQNYFKLESKIIQFSFSHSDSDLPDSWRLDGSLWNLKYTDKLSFNFSGQLWDQPEIKFYNHDNITVGNGLGGLFTSTVNYDISTSRNSYGLTVEIGYKSIGYALGEQLNKGMIIRGGLFFRLGNDK